ncbi:hypothetical protein [Helicobacter sp. 23-1045]
MDCHEVATSATSRNDKMESENSHNLAMTEKRQILDSANQTKNAESHTKITHPLNPPPQGRGNFLDSAKRTKCCRI